MLVLLPGKSRQQVMRLREVWYYPPPAVPANGERSILNVIDDLATLVKAIRTNVMTQVCLAGSRLNGKSALGQFVMRTTHTAS